MKNTIYTAFIAVMLITHIAFTGCASQQSLKTISSDTSLKKTHLMESSCFQFSDIEFKTLNPDVPQFSAYMISAKAKNTCMENFDEVCIIATYYDSDNMVVATKTNMAPFQHGITRQVGFTLPASSSMNIPVRQELKAYIVDPGQGYLYCI